jgi:hypothetical protein
MVNGQLYANTTTGVGVQGKSSCAASSGVLGCSTSSGNGVKGVSTSGIGVLGCSPPSGGVGVKGTSTSGIGVQGESSSIAVQGLAGAAGAIPLVAKGASGQTAPLQEWQNNAGTTLALVNNCGYIGINTLSPQRRLCVNGRIHASCGLGIGTQCINTSLAVNGSFAARTVKPTCSTYEMKTSDFAVFGSVSCSTVVLPAAKTQNGMLVFIKNISSGTVTVLPSGTDSIEGNSSEPLKKKYDSLQLISNGSNEWFVVGSVKCGAVYS